MAYWKHLKLITRHKWFVFKACCKAGIPWRGVLHDCSKYSPTEYLESVKYYTGKSSPIDEAKKQKGYSEAWFHHRGRNKHHWEYWVDNLSDGGRGTLMPYKYAVELICDYIGAGQAYENTKWTFDRPYDYWAKLRKEKGKIHPDIVAFIDKVLKEMKRTQSYDVLDPAFTKHIYQECTKKCLD